MNMQDRRKAAAMMTLNIMRSELDKLPNRERLAINAYIDELRKRVREPLFDSAIKIVAVETQLQVEMPTGAAAYLKQTHEALQAKIDSQNKEFDAVASLSEQYRRLTCTAPVDDDYPAVRYDYEASMVKLIEALKANGRTFHD